MDDRNTHTEVAQYNILVNDHTNEGLTISAYNYVLMNIIIINEE